MFPLRLISKVRKFTISFGSGSDSVLPDNKLLPESLLTQNSDANMPVVLPITCKSTSSLVYTDWKDDDWAKPKENARTRNRVFVLGYHQTGMLN